MSKTVITKIIEKDVVDAPPKPKPKAKKFSFDSEEELEKWLKNKKILNEYSKIKEELDKLKKEKAEKEKAAKEKEKAEFKKWQETVKKKEEEKRQKDKKAYEEWLSKQNKGIKLPKLIQDTDGNNIELFTFLILFIGVMLYMFLQIEEPSKDNEIPDLSLSALREMNR